PLDQAVVTVGSIHGGTKRNIIPEEVTLLLTVRSYKEEVRDRILASIRRIAEFTARAAGIPEDRLPQVTVRLDERLSAIYNHSALTERIVQALKAELGADAVSEIRPTMTSEDFGLFSLGNKIPSLL